MWGRNGLRLTCCCGLTWFLLAFVGSHCHATCACGLARFLLAYVGSRRHAVLHTGMWLDLEPNHTDPRISSSPQVANYLCGKWHGAPCFTCSSWAPLPTVRGRPRVCEFLCSVSRWVSTPLTSPTHLL